MVQSCQASPCSLCPALSAHRQLASEVFRRAWPASVHAVSQGLPALSSRFIEVVQSLPLVSQLGPRQLRAGPG